jgi:hypothetical protein
MQYASDEEARFLAKDSSGFLKVITDLGVHTHLGISTSFKPTESPPTALIPGAWMGCENGSIYDLSENNRKLRVADSTAISCLLHYDNKVFIGTEGEGLFVYKSEADSLTSIPLSDNYVYDLILWEGKVYVATDRGIEVLSAENDKVVKKLNSSITTGLCLWNDQLVASEYGKGLVLFRTDGSSETIEIPGEIKKMISAEGRLFVLSEKQVFEIIEGRGHSEIFRSESIIDMAYLPENGLAILHRDGRLTFVDLRFSVFHKSEGATITALARNDSAIFIAEGGSVKSRPLEVEKEVPEINLPQSPVIVNMVATTEMLFVGTFDQGLFSVNLRSGAMRNYSLDEGLLDNSVLGMAMMSDTLWFSSLSGLAFLAPDDRIDYIEGINSTYIYDLQSDQGILWIGTDGNGLLKKEGSRISSASEALEGSTVYRISQDAQGHFLFITKSRGIYQLTSSGIIRQESEVQYEGYTSFGSGPESTTLLIDDGKLILNQSGKTAVYKEGSGFDILTDAYLNTFTKPTEKAVYFGSGTTVYRYQPNQTLPEVQVELVEATSDFEPISSNPSEIDYEANNLIFKLAAPWYRNPEDIEFRYRLKGLEEEFRLTKNPDLIYPNLRYGEYVLEAQAGYNGIFHDSPRNLISFSIKRPFYLNPWFIILAILFLGFIVYFIVKIRVANINRLRLAEKRMVESELAVLRTQVNPHFLFNSFNTLMTIIESDSKAGAEYLEKLSDFYRRILEENKSQVISIQEELRILEEYIFLQKKRFGEAFEVEIRLSEESKKGYIPALTLQLLAENALKHNMATRSNPLLISIEDEGDFVKINNPICKKRQEAKGTGMGLENIRSRYEALFGKNINIENDGKHFSVKLPKIKAEDARIDS